MSESVRAWQPDVPLVHEVLHARFEQHAYPAHTHDVWTVLLIDDGAVAYELDRAAHHAVPSTVTLLPPHVAHDGRSAVSGTSFRKRVLYLDESWLPSALVAAAVADPLIDDPRALAAVTAIHAAVLSPANRMAAEEGVLGLRALLKERWDAPASTAKDVPLARRLRSLLDDRLTEGVTIAEAASLLGVHPDHLVRVFSQAYGIAPHRYLTARRVDRARHLLVQGVPAAQAAAEAGFHDQAHLARHFRRVLGTTPGAFAA